MAHVALTKATDLPDAVFLVIHSFLTVLDRCSVAMVSRWWRASLGDTRVWATINMKTDAYDVTPGTLRTVISTALNVTQPITGFQISTVS
jgi:hypothetical protein